MKGINTCCWTFPILSSFSTNASVFVMSVPLLHLLFMTTENRTHRLNKLNYTEIMWKFQSLMTDQGFKHYRQKKEKLASQNEQSLHSEGQSQECFTRDANKRGQINAY